MKDAGGQAALDEAQQIYDERLKQAYRKQPEKCQYSYAGRSDTDAARSIGIFARIWICKVMKRYFHGKGSDVYGKCIRKETKSADF